MIDVIFYLAVAMVSFAAGMSFRKKRDVSFNSFMKDMSSAHMTNMVGMILSKKEDLLKDYCSYLEETEWDSKRMLMDVRGLIKENKIGKHL